MIWPVSHPCTHAIMHVRTREGFVTFCSTEIFSLFNGTPDSGEKLGHFPKTAVPVDQIIALP